MSHKAIADQYIDDVLSVKQVACKLVIAACQRQLRDLERQNTEEFPYYFDPKEADEVCSFFPLALRHSKGAKFAGMPFELQPWQVFTKWVLFGWKRCADDTRRFRRAHISIARKNGKALSLDTVLPTPDGYTTMGEVRVGDTLIGMNGEPVRVLAATGVMQNRDCYRLAFSTGESVVCDGQHEWLTNARVQLVGCGGKGRKQNSRGESVKSTVSIADSVRYGVRNDVNHSVRLCQQVSLPDSELPLDPYTFGAWLGDGTSTSFCITCSYSDTEILDRIKQSGLEIEELRSSNVNSGHFAVRNGGMPFTSKLREMGVLRNKHIPIEYMRASAAQRMELLRGLMDTDGYVSPKGQCEFVSINKALAEQVKELVCSFGVKASLLVHDATLNGRFISKKYRVCFFAFQPFVPFAIERKAVRVPEASNNKRRSTTRQIVSCERVRSVPVRCVTVEGGMYCCTSSFIPTHNSTDAAGLGLYGLMCDGEPGAEVYVSATKKDQAKCVFEEAERMREASPALSRLIKSHVNNLFIDAPGMHGFFRPTSSDKPLDGPNPHFVIFDELHAWKEVHRKFYNTMVTGGGARTQPLQLTITTAGDDKSLIWLEEYNHCKGVVLGDLEDDSIFVYIAEIDDDDDPLDENCWIKANPNLGVSVSMDYMRQQAKDAVNKPSFYSVFVSKHCNKITSSTEKAFEMSLWDACKGDLSNWRDADAIGCGVDLGGRDDLAAYALVARFRHGGNDEAPVWRYEAQIRAYIAENTTRDLQKQPFAQFVYDDLIKVVRFPVNSLRDDLLEECMELGVPMAGYDPYNGQQLGEEIAAAGMQAVRVSQTYGMYNEPIRDLQACIKDKRFTYDGSPLLRWCANNAVIVKDNKDHWMYDKSKSSDKIDPIVAMTMAFRLAMLAPARATGSLYL